jgi:hypothetical protein
MWESLEELTLHFVEDTIGFLNSNALKFSSCSHQNATRHQASGRVEHEGKPSSDWRCLSFSVSFS